MYSLCFFILCVVSIRRQLLAVIRVTFSYVLNIRFAMIVLMHLLHLLLKTVRHNYGETFEAKIRNAFPNLSM